jgi:hypothetical protein
VIHFPVIDGEEWWASDAIDATTSIVARLSKLAETCISLKVNVSNATDFLNELTLIDNSNSVQFITQKGLRYCKSLSDTEVKDKAFKVEFLLKKYIEKHLPQGFI